MAAHKGPPPEQDPLAEGGPTREVSGRNKPLFNGPQAEQLASLMKRLLKKPVERKTEVASHIVNLSQTVEVASAFLPRFDPERPERTPLELVAPLRTLDMAPLTFEEFLQQVTGSTVRLPEPWGLEGGSTGRVNVKPSEHGPLVHFYFFDVRSHVLLEVPPRIEWKLRNGQVVFVELRPRVLVADEASARLAELKAQQVRVASWLVQETNPDAQQQILTLLDTLSDRRRKIEGEASTRSIVPPYMR